MNNNTLQEDSPALQIHKLTDLMNASFDRIVDTILAEDDKATQENYLRGAADLRNKIAGDVSVVLAEFSNQLNLINRIADDAGRTANQPVQYQAFKEGLSEDIEEEDECEDIKKRLRKQMAETRRLQNRIFSLKLEKIDLQQELGHAEHGRSVLRRVCTRLNREMSNGRVNREEFKTWLHLGCGIENEHVQNLIFETAKATFTFQ